MSEGNPWDVVAMRSGLRRMNQITSEITANNLKMPVKSRVRAHLIHASLPTYVHAWANVFSKMLLDVKSDIATLQ
jgi:hypothetical protein